MITLARIWGFWEILGVSLLGAGLVLMHFAYVAIHGATRRRTARSIAGAAVLIAFTVVVITSGLVNLFPELG